MSGLNHHPHQPNIIMHATIRFKIPEVFPTRDKCVYPDRGFSRAQHLRIRTVSNVVRLKCLREQTPWNVVQGEDVTGVCVGAWNYERVDHGAYLGY